MNSKKEELHSTIGKGFSQKGRGGAKCHTHWRCAWEEFRRGADIAKELINLGYDYIAFGGLVPLARNTLEVLTQIGGISDLNNPTIDPESALGLCLLNGCNTHILD